MIPLAWFLLAITFLGLLSVNGIKDPLARDEAWPAVGAGITLVLMVIAGKYHFPLTEMVLVLSLIGFGLGVAYGILRGWTLLRSLTSGITGLFWAPLAWIHLFCRLALHLKVETSRTK